MSLDASFHFFSSTTQRNRLFVRTRVFPVLFSFPAPQTHLLFKLRWFSNCYSCYKIVFKCCLHDLGFVELHKFSLC